MPDQELKRIADNAEMIVKGYAFTPREDGFISILNLEHPECAMIVDHDGNLVETNMDRIEQKLTLDLCRRNLQFIGE